MDNLINNKIITEIEDLLQKVRSHVAVEVNKTLLKTYMEIGRLIVEDINTHENKEDYQSKTISMLSKELTKKFGRGIFSCKYIEYNYILFSYRPVANKNIGRSCLAGAAYTRY